MNPNDEQQNDNQATPASPDPLQNSPQGNSPDDQLNTTQDIPADKDIDPDPTLSTYQDDIQTGEQEDRVHYEQHSDQPKDVLGGMPEDQIKEGLDQTAMDEQEYSPDQHDETGLAGPSSNDHAADDWREHTEDMDEADKDRSTDDSWTDRATG